MANYGLIVNSFPLSLIKLRVGIPILEYLGVVRTGR